MKGESDTSNTTIRGEISWPNYVKVKFEDKSAFC